MSLLLVYNTCGIAGRENIQSYVRNIKTYLNQSFTDYKFVVSSCLNSDDEINTLINEFGNRIEVNRIREELPVNITYNFTVKKSVEKFGEFDGYVYIDSGVHIEGNSLGLFQERLDKYPEYGILTARQDRDNGYAWFYGTDDLPFEKDFIIPVGKGCNPNITVTSKELVRFYGKPCPDIFAAYCTENTYSFLCAALKKYFVIANDIFVSHAVTMDGQSCYLRGRQDHDQVYLLNKNMYDIVHDPEMVKYGFGYEEWRAERPQYTKPQFVRNHLIHDSSQYDENGFCVNDKLKDVLKKNLWLPKEVFDYERINHEWVTS